MVMSEKIPDRCGAARYVIKSYFFSNGTSIYGYYDYFCRKTDARAVK